MSDESQNHAADIQPLTEAELDRVTGGSYAQAGQGASKDSPGDQPTSDPLSAFMQALQAFQQQLHNMQHSQQQQVTPDSRP